MRKIDKITEKQMADKGVSALPTRPGDPKQYGGRGMSAEELRHWFDQLVRFSSAKINEIIDAMSGENGADYIKINGFEECQSLAELLATIALGSFANTYLKVNQSAASEELITLQACLNAFAQSISGHSEALESAKGEIDAFNRNIEIISSSVTDLAKNKLTVDNGDGANVCLYAVDEDGNQVMKLLSSLPRALAAVMYDEGGHLKTDVPAGELDAVNKKYFEERYNKRASSLDVSLDEQTYVLSIALKNAVGEVMSERTIDFPLESVIVNGSYNNGVLTFTLQNGNTVDVVVSDIISGLATTAALDAAVARFSTAEEESAASAEQARQHSENALAAKQNIVAALGDVGDIEAALDAILDIQYDLMGRPRPTKGLSYAIGGGSVTLYGIGTATSVADIVIADRYKGSPVERINDAAFNNVQTIESVIIPESIKNIQPYAFNNCRQLKTINIYSNPNAPLLYISSYAFAFCVSLESIIIPNRVSSISASAFTGCRGLNEIHVQWASYDARSEDAPWGTTARVTVYYNDGVSVVYNDDGGNV